MRLRITKNGISVSNFKLSSTDIEQQVATDLSRFNKDWFSKYKQAPQPPLDVDSFIKLLWNIDIVYDNLAQSNNEEVLGCFEPDQQKITIDAKACNNPRRVSFTVAHEAGHLSLHSFLFEHRNGKIVGWKNGTSSANKNLERQADLYAASLLSPRQEVYDFLLTKGLSSGNGVIQSIDLSAHAISFQERFGLSRQALEIRLRQLNLSVTNKKYPD